MPPGATLFLCASALVPAAAGGLASSDPVAVLGDPVAVLGDPVAVLGDPVAVLGDPVAVLGDPVAVLGAWRARFEAGGIEWSGRAEAELAALAAGASALAAADPARSAEVDRELLDLAGLGFAAAELAANGYGGAVARDETAALRSLAERAGAVGARALLAIAGGEDGSARLGRALREVLLVPSSHPLPRRRAALALVADARPAEGPLALLALAGDARDPLRPAALWAAAEWPDPRLDAFLVDNLARPHDSHLDPHPFSLLSHRLARGAPLDAGAAAALADRTLPLLADLDWRQASRGIELARRLPLERGAPLLVEALAGWQGRAALGRGSRRIEHEIVSALQRLSGKSIGAHPERWRAWWRAVQAGAVEPALAGGEVSADRTSATFFGLRPVSDRVTFVIDKSGSMANRTGTAERTRYQQAIEQLVAFLEASGTDTRFNVVLFGSEALLSSRELVRAVPGEIDRARRSLLAREPEGGTGLRAAIELSLALGPGGRPDLGALEADTVVVLCDGRTDEGPGWVPAFLAGAAAETRVVFHCVLLASEGDGTLEALAAGTGGDFVRAGG